MELSMGRALFILVPALLAVYPTAIACASPQNEPRSPNLVRQLQDASGPAFAKALAQFSQLPVSERASIARRLGDKRPLAVRLAPRLVRMLEDPSTFVRAEAAASLSRLGNAAFPAMRDALTSDHEIETQVPDEDYESDRRLSDYLSWAFANSIADPGPTLIAWARRHRKGPPRAAVPEPVEFVATTLAARGDLATPHAIALLRSRSAYDKKLGVFLVRRIGEGAASAAPLVAGIISPSADWDVADEAISALGRLGEPGQVELARLFMTPGLAAHRGEIASAMGPGPVSLAAQIRVAKSGDSQARDMAVWGLTGQSELPPEAVPILIEAAKNSDNPSILLETLSRAPLDASSALQVMAVAQAEFDAVLRRATPYPYATSAILALGHVGREGIESLRSRFADPRTHERACRAASFLPDDSTEAVDAVRTVAVPLCKGLWTDPTQERVRELARLKVSPNRVQALFEALANSDLEIQTKKALCAGATLSAVDRAAIASHVVADEWYDLADAADHCPELFVGPPSLAILKRINAGDPAFEHWAADWGEELDNLLAAMSMDREARLGDWSVELVRASVASVARIRTWAARRLGDISYSPAARTILLRALQDKDRRVAEAAAESILSAGPEAAEWAQAAAVATYFGLEREVEAYADGVDGLFLQENEEQTPDRGTAGQESTAGAGPTAPSGTPPSPPAAVCPAIADCRPPITDEPPPPPPPPPPPAPEREGGGIIIPTGSRIQPLPQFPWPPPRYSSIVTFGSDLDRNLLGSSTDSLERVHKRLVDALVDIDPGFERRLFAAPGGFVLLTRLEQTQEDGRPLIGRDRWRDVRPPPHSATDFLVRLFLAPPGYYRTIAFLFTDQSNFSSGTAPLPRFEQGGTILPHNIGSLTYESRNAYALIYSFRKRDAGVAQHYRLLSGRQHLQKSGVIRALQRR